MARPARKNVIYHYGDSWNDLGAVWVDADGVGVNLAGFTAALKIKDKAGGILFLGLTSSGGGLTIDAPNGVVDIDATPAQMLAGTLVQGGRYVYELQVSSPAETKTLLEGTFWVDPDVTD